MKRTSGFTFALFLLGICLPAFSRAEEASIPPGHDVEWYRPIWVRSPFGPPSVSSEEKASGSWVLTGMAGSAEEPMAFIQNRETQEHLALTKKLDDKGFQIISTSPQADLMASSATVRTPQGEIVVKFDHDLLAAVPAPPPNAPPAMPTPANAPSGFFAPPPGSQPPNGFINRPVHLIHIPSPPPAQPGLPPGARHN